MLKSQKLAICQSPDVKSFAVWTLHSCHFLSPLSAEKLDSSLNLHHHSFISSSLSNSSLSRSRTAPMSPPSPSSPTSISLPTHHRQHSSPPSTIFSRLTVKQGARLKGSGYEWSQWHNWRQLGLLLVYQWRRTKGVGSSLQRGHPWLPPLHSALFVFLVYSTCFACYGLLALGLRLFELVNSVLS